MFLNNFLFTNYLEDSEDIWFVAHKHIWVYRKKLTKEFLLGLVMPVIFHFVYPPFFLLWLGWAFVGFLRFLYAIADWYYDAWLITNMSIIDVEWNGFFSRQSSRIEYHTIDGLQYIIQGFWQTILNYGNVQIQQIGGAIVVEMKEAARPRNVEREILKVQERVISDKSRREHEALKDILAGLVQHNMRK
ncbi:hypothetical protein HOG48_01415 [Candidatus Peregrinibacteria bacterium]|jgi:hypothetical protein|nr:hypothetical protein [Candidatus Peregrinibacteria bacterium]